MNGNSEARTDTADASWNARSEYTSSRSPDVLHDFVRANTDRLGAAVSGGGVRDVVEATPPVSATPPRH
jgi:hypothetical protein